MTWVDRSYLFVPGDRPERFDKALASGAHAVILDLEDAVLPERKDAAREAMSTWLSVTSARVFVRINPADTSWHVHDRELLDWPSVKGVLWPKAEKAAELEGLAQGLRPDQVLIPIIETVAGFFAVDDLARVRAVSRLAFGSVDFMADSGIEGDGPELDSVRTPLVLASRRAGIQAPIDGVSLSVSDMVQIESDALRSRRWGFGAKLCIHPKQVDCVHRAFSPSAEEMAWARKVVQAIGQGSLGAVAVEGKLVDKPVVLRAQAILSSAVG